MLILGIEIGGTKLQLGVGTDAGPPFLDFRRHDVDPTRGAAGIRDQILATGRELIEQHNIDRIGYGFGGPLNTETGRVTTSHQIEGWTNFPIVEWTQRELGVPTILGNDCDVASLGEARYGAGQGRRSVFYVTVGTGIGGGLVIDDTIQGHGRPACAEIGHLRPAVFAGQSDATVESIASGWGISNSARAHIAEADPAESTRLMELCDGDLSRLTTKHIGQAANAGDDLACSVLLGSIEVLGWAIAQVETLLAPEVVVVGGGVSLIGEEHFLTPLRDAVDRYVFPPLRGSFEILPAKLGEDAVVYGAIANAARQRD